MWQNCDIIWCIRSNSVPLAPEMLDRCADFCWIPKGTWQLRTAWRRFFSAGNAWSVTQTEIFLHRFLQIECRRTASPKGARVLLRFGVKDLHGYSKTQSRQILVGFWYRDMFYTFWKSCFHAYFPDSAFSLSFAFCVFLLLCFCACLPFAFLLLGFSAILRLCFFLCFLTDQTQITLWKWP